MKNLNIKNLVVRGTVSLAMVLTTNSVIAMPVYATSESNAIVEETVSEEQKREVEGFKHFKRLFFKREYSDNPTLSDKWSDVYANIESPHSLFDYLTAKWNDDYLNNKHKILEYSRSLFAYLDKHYLSTIPFCEESDYDSIVISPEGYVNNGYLKFNSLRLWKESGDISFYKTNDGTFMDYYENTDKDKSSLEEKTATIRNQNKLGCSFDSNGHIIYEYQCYGIDDQKYIMHAIVRYCPYTGKLEIDSYLNWVPLIPTETIYSGTFNIPTNQNIQMIDQMATLFTKQISATEIVDHVTEIVNAKYGFSDTEIVNQATEIGNDKYKSELTKYNASDLVVVNTREAYCSDFMLETITPSKEFYVLNYEHDSKEKEKFSVYSDVFDDSFIAEVSPYLNIINYYPKKSDVPCYMFSSSANDGIYSIQDFLVKNGFTDMIEDQYTEETLKTIIDRAKTNEVQEDKNYRASDLYIVDTSFNEIDHETNSYYVIRYVGDKNGHAIYSDIMNPKALVTVDTIDNLVYDEGLISYLWIKDAFHKEHVKSIHEVLKEKEMTDALKDEYTQEDLENINNCLNFSYTKVLTLE